MLPHPFKSTPSFLIVSRGMKIWESHEVSETLKVIYHPFIFCVSIGFAVLSLTLIVDFLKTLLKKEVN